MSDAVQTLINTNIAEQLEPKATDTLTQCSHKACIKAGYRAPHTICTTAQDIERMVEVWPVIAASAEVNSLSNLIGAIRTGFAGCPPHLVKQLVSVATAMWRIITCPQMTIKEQRGNTDLSPIAMWTILEPLIDMGRALINFLLGKIPKNDAVPSTQPAPVVLPQVPPVPKEETVSLAMVQKMIADSHANRGQGGGGGGSHGGGTGGGKRRRW